MTSDTWTGASAPTKKTQRLHILRGTVAQVWDGESKAFQARHVQPDEVLEVLETDAIELRNRGKARLAEAPALPPPPPEPESPESPPEPEREPAAIETREPVVEHRDPAGKKRKPARGA